MFYLKNVSGKSGILYLIYLIPVISFAQVNIKGKINDSTQGLPFANVLVLNPKDSSLVKGTITNDNGEFDLEKIPAGNYLISASMVGYDKFYAPLNAGNNDVSFPEIELKESSQELANVVVKADKPLFEQQIDRMVINVASSITSSGNSVLGVLQKSPGVVVNRQNNSISVNGKSGTVIMLNGKISHLPQDALIQILDGMNASNVEKIEIITTPPAKYDAEGNAGFINIVTKVDADYGNNGSIGLTLGKSWREIYGGTFNFNHRGKNIGLFMDYSALVNHNQQVLFSSRQVLNEGFLQNDVVNSVRRDYSTNQNLRIGLEWNITKSTQLGFSVSGNRSLWNMKAVTNDNSSFTADSSIMTNMDIKEINRWKSATGSFGIDQKVGKNSTLSFNLDYLYYDNSNPSDYDNFLSEESPSWNDHQKIRIDKLTPIHFIVGSLDYSYHITPSFLLETGMKETVSHLDNNIFVNRWYNDIWTRDPVLSSVSSLDEDIMAGYLSLQWQISKTIQLNTGLRYEHTQTLLDSALGIPLVNKKYSNLFPSVFFKKSLNDKSDLQVSYSRRITRPTFNDIAPFVFFFGPRDLISGNADLLPAISDGFKMDYRLSQIIFSLMYTHIQNQINFLQPVLEDSSATTQVYVSQNLKYTDTYGLNVTVPFNLAEWWGIQSNVLGTYNTYVSTQPKGDIRFNVIGAYFNLTNSFELPGNFSLELSGNYIAGMTMGLIKFKPMGSINAGLQKKFSNGKDVLRLSANDMFNTATWNASSDLPDYNLNVHFTMDWHTRDIRLTYTHNFGNTKLRSVKVKSGAQEERNRVNTSN